MAIIITKEDFENAVSVATSAQIQIFEKLQPAIERAAENCVDSILGPAAAAIETSKHVKDFVCLDAFVHELRQLDLVLTPTGFGVVANNTTSPASKARVDALEESLQFAREYSLSTVLELCREQEGWGNSKQAKENIVTPLYSLRKLERYPSLEDYRKYKKMTDTITECDFKVRKLIGNAQMDDIMQQIRNNTDNVVYCDAARIICEYIRMVYWQSPCCEEKKRYLLGYLETNSSTFDIYMKSDEYKANHYEPYRNTKDSRVYFF